MSKSPKAYLAFDLGASSGRAVLGLLAGGRLDIREINRFDNRRSPLGGRLYWDFLSLWNNLRDSMRLCAREGYSRLSGIGVDTWGVDFGLLGADGALLGNPLCYRDTITEGIEQFMDRAIGEKELYRLTGIAPTRMSTLSQLVALGNGPAAGTIRFARTLLMMSDLFRYFLSGHKAVELTAVGSSQLIDVNSGRWCSRIFKALRVPRRIMPEIVRPATVVGRLPADLAAEAGLNRAPVVAVAGHDTASAAAAVPLVGADCAFLSCGTWSVLGVTEQHPITTAEAFSRRLTNMIGLESILFARVGMGMYLFFNLRRAQINSGRKTNYAQMTKEASGAKPFGCFLDVDCPVFFSGDDPEPCVRDFLRRTGQRVLRDSGSINRAVLEGLAWSYRAAVDALTAVIGRELKKISLVGGGSRNKTLCQMVADATGLEVIAGPVETTAVGNLAIQALATGQLQDTTDIRQLVRDSFRLKTYRPRSTELWDRHSARYLEIVEKSTKLK